MITGIIAVAKNFAIGKDGKLPWHYSADLKFFKQTTTGSAVVMGLHTWKSIGRPLPNRLNIILSRSANIENQPNVLLLRSVDETIALSKFLNGDLYVIGGAETYKTFAGVIEKWIVTEIPESVENADTFMPADFLEKFIVSETIELENNLRVKIYQKLS